MLTLSYTQVPITGKRKNLWVIVITNLFVINYLFVITKLFVTTAMPIKFASSNKMHNLWTR